MSPWVLFCVGLIVWVFLCHIAVVFFCIYLGDGYMVFSCSHYCINCSVVIK